MERVGKRCPIVWDIEWSYAKMIKIQYMVAFIGRPTKKQAALMEGSMEGIIDKRDAWGRRDAIILGVL